MTAVPVEDLRAVLGTVADLIDGVGPGEWNNPTPCPEWEVRDLVNHMVLGHRLFTGILRGEATVAPGALDPAAADLLSDDPAASYRAAAEGLLLAFGQPGVLEQDFHVPVGRVPGFAAVHLRAVEELAHGWDLAQATDQQPRFPDAVVERQLEFTRDKLADVPPDQSPFAPPQPVPEHSPPLDRLAALLGRATRPER